jgi:hypothetical protein
MDKANGWAREKRKRKSLYSRTPSMPAAKSDGRLIPSKFTPRFWRDSDQNAASSRMIERRYQLLKEHTGADSYQRDLLCQRVAFISVILETIEVGAAEGEGLDLGVYVQACNSLTGLLKTLGLDKQVKNVTDLKDYLKERQSK